MRMYHLLYRTGRPPAGSALTVMLVLASLMLTGATLPAQDFSSRKNLTREFAAKRGLTLELQNKYGKVEVMSWEKDSVKIDVEMEISESSASKLRKLKEDISIDFSSTGSYIIARTRFKSESSRIASELKSIGHTISGSNKHVEINYLVYVPKYMALVIENKFGDIFLDDLNGQVSIDLSNGALKTGHLAGKANLKLRFARAMIGSMEVAAMNMNYSDMSMGSALQLELASKSSKLRGDSINVLKIDSRRDQLYFKQVEYFTGNSSFSEIQVYDFIRETDVYMRYGKLNLDRVDPQFSKIYVESDYTDLNFHLDAECRFRYANLHPDQAQVRLPDGADGATASTQGEEHLKTTGTYGGSNPTANITIDALQKCFINLTID